MTTPILQLEQAGTGGQLAARCRALGVPLLQVTPEGAIARVWIDPKWWLDRLIIESPLFAQALTDRAVAWVSQEHHEAEPLWPGCWGPA